MESRTSKRSAAGLLIATVVAIAIVLLWKGSSTDQPPPADVGEVRKDEPAPEPARYALVQGTDTEFGRVPSATSSTDESTSKVRTPDPPPVATLDVVLLDGKDAIGAGAIVLKPEHEGRASRGTVDPRRRTATFENLAIGDWHVEDITDLPSGLLPPRKLQRGGGSDPITLSVKAGSNRLEVLLEHAARVFGYVRGADGEPIDNFVRLRAVSDDWNQSAQSKDFHARKGYYEGDYYAGLCEAELIGEAEYEAGERETYPDPRILLLPSGSSTEIDFALQRIPGRIEGGVLDEKGLPMGQLKLYLYRHVPLQDPATGRMRDPRPCVANATTDVDGRFAFGSLAPGRYSIDASDGNFRPLGKPGESRLGVLYPGKDVELGDSLFARTELSVVRSHPCRVHGSVVVDPEWSRRQANRDFGVDIRLLTHEPREDGKDTESQIWAWGGKFDFFLDAATPDPRLRAWIGETSVIFPLALVPDAELPELVLRFPQ